MSNPFGDMPVSLIRRIDLMRSVALGSARAQFRKMGIDPVTQTAQDAFLVLDDLLRSEPDLVAARWYRDASKLQIKKFIRDWDRWVLTRRGAK